MAPAFDLPREYAMAAAFVELRIAERFGVGDPFGWWGGLTLAQRAVVWGYEKIREAEDAQRSR